MQSNQTVFLEYPNQMPAVGDPSFSVVFFDGRDHFMEVNLKKFGKTRVTFGRSDDNDIVLNSSLVSRHHGWFDISGSRIVVHDEQSTNGILINGTRKLTSEFLQGDMLRIDKVGQTKPDGVLMIAGASDGASAWKKYALEQSVTIGRDEDNDIVLSHVGVSGHHALIRRTGDQVVLEDLHSTNGVFVNGGRISQAVLQEKDIITLLNTKLIYSNGCLYAYTYQTGLRIDARNVTKMVKNKGKDICICDRVSLSVKPGSLVAIIGGSGAGKSTFMNAISGYNQPTSGQVLVNGEELYRHYDALKNIIGYVPQQDIVYDNLTLFDMLLYAAKLRLPDDTKAKDREKRVHAVIEMVELQGKEHTLIGKLSGGQKKRASIAVELLSDPSLFFLDEPASGLDPGTERNLMKTLKKMAAAGKTVILVTHSTLNLQECDKIIFMGAGGRLCYYGSAAEAMAFFEVNDLVDIYNLLTEESVYWSEKYKKELGKPTEEPARTDSKKIGEKSRHRRLRQVAVLSTRYLKLMLNDRQRLLLLLLQAPVLAFLISLVKDGNQYYEAGITRALLFAMTCSAFWLGMLNSIQEICKERVILRREHMTGVHLGSYVLSKFFVLGLLSLVQSAMLTGVYVAMVGTPDVGVAWHPALEFYVTTFLTAMTSVATGLFISSLFRNADRAMTVAPLMLMPQILFSGILFELEGATNIISNFAISRWAMEGYGTTANLNDLKHIFYIAGVEQEYNVAAQDYFTYTREHLLTVWGILGVFVVVFGVLSVINLRKIKKNG